MAQLSICNEKFTIDDSLVVDPRANSPWQSLQEEALQEAIAAAFDTPHNFPPITQAVLAEDQIAIAVEPDTPCGWQVACLVAQRFVDQGSAPTQITIVCSEPVPETKWNCVQHDGTDEEQMAYLAVDQQGVPLYINRTLFEADIVVPIGTGDGGRRRCSICPTYCSVETQNHIARQKPKIVNSIARMIDNNLGVFWQVRIVTEPGDQVVKVLVGESEAVLEASSELGNQVWNVDVSEPSNMVLATIESPASQSWWNLRRARSNADALVAEGGSIVICTDLGGRPPTTWPNPDEADTAKAKDSELREVFQRRLLFLASRLTQEPTERIGFGFVENLSLIHISEPTRPY